MARKPKREIITGIEIGTSTIKVVMGEFLPDDVLAIVGVGQAQSLHVQKGEILDVEKVLGQLARAVSSAENSSGIVIDGPIFLASTGAHIHPLVAVGRTMVQTPNRVVSEDDIVAAVQGARSYSLPPDQKIIHTSERCFRVDDGNRVVSALGRVGDWLSSEVLLIIGRHAALQTVCTMVQDLMGYKARDIAFSGVAASFAAFGAEDAEHGQLLIDIGAGVTEYVVFHGNGCYYAGQITVGCDHIANDLAIGLRLPQARAKAMVRDLGDMGCSADRTLEETPQNVDLRLSSGVTREIPRASIEEIVELRLTELFTVIRKDLAHQKVQDHIGGGVKLCGGGALIPGITDLAQRVLGVPVEIGKPRHLSGKEDILSSPVYMTPVGLIRWGKLVMDIEAKDHPPTLRHQLWRDARNILGVIRESFRI